MRSINKVILIGNLTRDPEMRETPSGQQVATFGLATNREWVTKNSERKNSAEFHECVAWAKLAEICKNYIKKGSLVYVEGYLKTRNWETTDGTRKFKTEIIVQDMIILEKKSSNSDEYVPMEEIDNEDTIAEEPKKIEEENKVHEEKKEETTDDNNTKDKENKTPEVGIDIDADLGL